MCLPVVCFGKFLLWCNKGLDNSCRDYGVCDMITKPLFYCWNGHQEEMDTWEIDDVRGTNMLKLMLWTHWPIDKISGIKFQAAINEYICICVNVCIYIYVWLTLNVLGPSYLGLTRSISWLLMSWLLASPGHQQPWYVLCTMGRSLSQLRKDFNHLCHINVGERHKM